MIMNSSSKLYSRREALGAIGLLALACHPLLTATAAPKKRAMALQLYTLRDPAKKDLTGTLKKVREMGWEYVQWSGMPNLPAEKIRAELDAAGLKATVAKLNQYARTGTDLDFHRGETVFDRYYGDEKVKPNACLAPIETPPFYGLESYPGELGTKGGLKADARARVLTEAGQPIPGLYAIGNCSAALMGRSYPGAGATIGPAMTFGYIAARDAIPGT